MDFNELYSINLSFCDLFHRALKCRRFKLPLEYLKNRRVKLSELNRFNLGYCDESTVYSFIKEKNYPQDILLQLGILKEYQGRVYPFFNKRLIFPIFDQYGKCVGFSGRRLDGNDENKYINSPASDIFFKRRILYPLYLNYDKLLKSRFAFLVEGYMDVISLFQYSFENVVCSMGTAFAEDQAKLLRRYVNKVVILYDGDKPGQQAASKAEEILKLYVKASKVFLPEDEDPDSFVKKFGVDKLKSYIKERI